MKICYFCSSYPPDIGGIATYNWQLTNSLSLDPRINQVQVIAFNSVRSGLKQYSHKLSVYYLGQRSFFGIGKQIYRNFKKFKDYDIFHAGNIFPVGWWLVLIAKVIYRKRVVIVNFYGTDVLSKEGSQKTKFLKYLTLKLASQAITISKSTLKRTVEKYKISPKKFTYIYYGLPVFKKSKIDIQEFKKIYNILEDDFVVLTTSRLIVRKAIDDIIRAVSLANDPKIKLLIVSSGPEQNYLRQLVKDLNISDQVVFAGKVKDTGPYYMISDVCVLSSFYIKELGDIEGLGIVLLEAQQYGLPVIGTNSGGIPEVIDDNISGFVIPERNPEALKEKIALLKKDNKLKRQMGINAKKFVEQKFNWSNSVAKHLIIYQNVRN